MTNPYNIYHDPSIPWHNPDSVGFDKLPEGYRFKIIEELGNKFRLRSDIKVFKSDGNWSNSGAAPKGAIDGTMKRFTYAVEIATWPLPEKYLKKATPPQSEIVWLKGSEHQPDAQSIKSGFVWIANSGGLIIAARKSFLTVSHDEYWTPYLGDVPPYIFPTDNSIEKKSPWISCRDEQPNKENCPDLIHYVRSVEGQIHLHGGLATWPSNFHFSPATVSPCPPWVEPEKVDKEREEFGKWCATERPNASFLDKAEWYQIWQAARKEQV